MNSRRVIAWVVAVGAGLVACGGTGSSGPSQPDPVRDASTDGPAVPDGAVPDRAADARPTRPFRLASTGAQLLAFGAPLGFQLTAANLTEDVDILAVHQEFYGLPWDAFESGSAPPAEWVREMDRLVALARAANKPIFLSVNLLDGSRRRLAAKTRVESGEVKTEEGWSADCYDFASAPDGAAKRRAYVAYVTYMTERFAPAYLNVGVELNLHFERCPAARAGAVDVVNAAYRAAKSQKGDAIVFPSFQLEHLYGYAGDSCSDPKDRATREACFEAHYADLRGVLRDRFAASAYPYAFAATAGEVPADYFTRAAARGNERPVLAETGWVSTPVVVASAQGACMTMVTQSGPEAAGYLTKVLDAAAAANMDLVTWWSDRDLLPAWIMTECPCRSSAQWCEVLKVFRGPAPADGGADTQLLGELTLKAFGTMGLRDYDGAPKPAMLGPWTAARALPWAGP